MYISLSGDRGVSTPSWEGYTGRVEIWPKLRILISIAGSSNGRTADSESVNLGSNPGPAATKLVFVCKTDFYTRCRL